MSALDTAKQCILAHVQVPINGLAIYSGEVCDLDGSNWRKICIQFEEWEEDVHVRHTEKLVTFAEHEHEDV